MPLFAFGPKHESCDKKLRALTERVEQLELMTAERNLQVLDVAERVAHKLQERTQKRKAVPPSNGNLTPQEKGAVVRQGGWDGLLQR